MRSIKKRVLAAAMAASMVVTMLPFTAMAEENNEVKHNWNIRAAKYNLIAECTDKECKEYAWINLNDNGYDVELQNEGNWEYYPELESYVKGKYDADSYEYPYKIMYEGVGDTKYEKSEEVPKNLKGTFKASTVIAGEKIELVYDKIYTYEEYLATLDNGNGMDDAPHVGGEVDYGALVNSEEALEKIVVTESERDILSKSKLDAIGTIQEEWGTDVKESAGQKQIRKEIDKNIYAYLHVNILFGKRCDFEGEYENDPFDTPEDIVWSSNVDDYIDEIERNLYDEDSYTDDEDIWVDEASEPIAFYIELPTNEDNEFSANVNDATEYEIVRNHEGKVEILDSKCVKDEEGKRYLIFETDKFYSYTDYALVYNNKISNKQNSADSDIVFVKGENARRCIDCGTRTYFKSISTGEKFKDVDGKNPITDEEIKIPAVGHDMGKVNANKATCATKYGNIEYYKCRQCKMRFATSDGKNPLEYYEIVTTGHNLTKVDGKNATCTEDGIRDYYKCTSCKGLFDDKMGYVAITEEDIKDDWFMKIDARGHDIEKVLAKKVTCGEDGIKEHYACLVCGKKFADEEGKNELQDADVIIKSDAHKLSKVEEKKATCTEDGTKAYYTCSECDKKFEDADGKKEIQDTDIPVKAEGHKLTAVEEKKATCTEDGTKAHYACSECNKKYEDAEGKKELQEADLIIKSANGQHKEVVIPGYEATCCSTGLTDGKKCSECGEVVEAQKTIDKTEHLLLYIPGEAATYTHDGYKAYYECYYCRSMFADWSGTVETNYNLIKINKLQVGVTKSIKAKTRKSSSITFTWNKVSGATGYRVYIAKNGKWVQLKSATTATSYTAKKLSAGTSYKFAVKAYKKVNGKAVWSNTFKTVTIKTLPGKTSKITSKSAGKGKVTLTWNKVKGASGYRLYYKQGKKWVTLKSSMSGNKIKVTGLKAGKKYTFAVKAYAKENGKTVWSDVMTSKNVTAPKK